MGVSEDAGTDVSWNTDDELEIDGPPCDSSSVLSNVGHTNFSGSCEASSSGGPARTKLFDHFLGMGFSEKLVARAIDEAGDDNNEAILETLLTYADILNAYEEQCVYHASQPPFFYCSVNTTIEHCDLCAWGNDAANEALEGSTEQELDIARCRQIDEDVELAKEFDAEIHNEIVADCDQKINADSDFWSSDYEENGAYDFSDSDSDEKEYTSVSLSEKQQKLSFLTDMGYPTDEASLAIERCGPNSSLEELANFLCAAQMARAEDPYYVDPPAVKKHKYLFNELGKHKRRRISANGFGDTEEHIRLPKPMVGFGVPTDPCPITRRKLPEAALGPPYFYYENVALAPKGVWDTISRFLYDVEPEFVDSKFFCAANRKRGYIHNLPIENRFPLLPLAPRTIHDALPLTKRWWPSWDARTKLNCLQTVTGSSRNTERIRKILEDWSRGAQGTDPPPHVQKFILDECRKWNFVWVGRNKVAPLEPDEVEILLGFPRNHTRGGGISRTDRYKSLGNSFQVDTVAYHLSVLKDKFPYGIKMLSLFSGIGGAEVALHRMGIPLKVVVSVEKSEGNRNVVRGWWEQTNQKGTLIDIEDVQQLTGDKLEQLMSAFGGFDLVIGGSPCNNLAGSNRVSRDGLEGKESSLFYDYFRILDLVRCIMGKK